MPYKDLAVPREDKYSEDDMNHLTFINNKIPFTVNLPNQPYVDDFSEGITHDCFYIGMNYIKVNRRISDGLILEVLTEAQTMKEIESRKIIHDEGCDSFIIDAREHPWEAAYITGRYYHEDIPNYEEELGTTDFWGKPEVWDYHHTPETGVLAQIYYVNSMYYNDGKFSKPKFREHIIQRESFDDLIQVHIRDTERELKRNVYKPEDIEYIKKYGEWLKTVPETYKNIKHWKIKFPPLPNYKP